MPERRRRTQTPPERENSQQRHEQKLQDLHAQLAAQVQSLTSGDQWKRYLRAAATFRDYSLNNLLLIVAQRPDATQVAGYGAWQKLGRQVRKGEKGIQIIAPIVRRILQKELDYEPSEDDRPVNKQHSATAAEHDDGKTTVPVQKQVTRFRVAHVFDVSQTDGDALPDPPASVSLTGDVAADLWSDLEQVATANGWRVDREPIESEANGRTYFADRLIRVRPDLSPAQSVKTFAHELGHALLEHQSGVHRGLAEVEAESVAYVVMAAHGIDAGSFSFPYIAGWGSGHDQQDAADMVRATADRVLTTARTILGSGTAIHPTAASDDAEALANRAAANAQAIAAVADQAALTAARPLATYAPPATPVVEPGRATHVQQGDPPLFAPEWKLDRLKAVNEDVASLYRTQLAKSPSVRRYLADRLGAGASLSQWTIGYAPNSWTAAVDYLRRRGHTDENIVEAGVGLISRHGTLVDRFRDRVMFAVRTADGTHCGWIGRIMPGADHGDAPKYLNTPATPLYTKGELLLGLYEQQNALTSAVPVVVEGPFDQLAIAATEHNNGRVIGLSAAGTAVTAEHLTLLDARLPSGREIVFALDGDAAGTVAVARSAEMALRLDREIYVTVLQDGHDPASHAHETGATSLSAYLGPPRRQPALDFLVDMRIQRHADQMQWVEGQIEAMHDVAQLFASQPASRIIEPALRAAARLHVDPVHMSTAIARARKERGFGSGLFHTGVNSLQHNGSSPDPPAPSAAAVAAQSAPQPPTATFCATATAHTAAPPTSRPWSSHPSPDYSAGR